MHFFLWTTGSQAKGFSYRVTMKDFALVVMKDSRTVAEHGTSRHLKNWVRGDHNISTPYNF